MTIHDYTEVAYKNGYAAGLKDGIKWNDFEKSKPSKDGDYLIFTGWGYMVLPYSRRWQRFNAPVARNEKEAARYEIPCVWWAELPPVPATLADKKENDR